MKRKICVIIRVFNRIKDLEFNLEIIRKTWTTNEYYVIVSSNGEQNGYMLTDCIISHSDKVVKCEGNGGHLKGNSLLLLQAIPSIPKDCNYTLLLEADTWLYKDTLINKYLEELERTGAVWASAQWYDRYYSLATDFALINSNYLINNKNILNFGNYPETYVANYLIENNQKYILIKENMLPQLPSYIKRYPYAPEGRFFVFPLSRMVTHHVELLKGGMNEKIRDFNSMSDNFFEIENVKWPKLKLLWIYIVFSSSFLFLRRSWYTNIKKFDS